ncbi:hypothetical protein ACFQZ8_25900, partial [Micromonospora azadirachtae]
MNTMPTELKTLRSRPAHSGHSVSGASEKDCTASSWWPHAVQAYWYVGTFSSGSGSAGWHSTSSSANVASFAPGSSSGRVGRDTRRRAPPGRRGGIKRTQTAGGSYHGAYRTV